MASFEELRELTTDKIAQLGSYDLDKFLQPFKWSNTENNETMQQKQHEIIKQTFEALSLQLKSSADLRMDDLIGMIHKLIILQKAIKSKQSNDPTEGQVISLIETLKTNLRLIFDAQIVDFKKMTNGLSGLNIQKLKSALKHAFDLNLMGFYVATEEEIKYIEQTTKQIKERIKSIYYPTADSQRAQALSILNEMKSIVAAIGESAKQEKFMNPIFQNESKLNIIASGQIPFYKLPFWDFTNRSKLLFEIQSSLDFFTGGIDLYTDNKLTGNRYLAYKVFKLLSSSNGLNIGWKEWKDKSQNLDLDKYVNGASIDELRRDFDAENAKETALKKMKPEQETQQRINAEALSTRRQANYDTIMNEEGSLRKKVCESLSMEDIAFLDARDKSKKLQSTGGTKKRFNSQLSRRTKSQRRNSKNKLKKTRYRRYK